MLKLLCTVSAILVLITVADARAEDRELTFHSGIEFAAAYTKQLDRGFRPIDLAMFTEKHQVDGEIKMPVVNINLADV